MKNTKIEKGIASLEQRSAAAMGNYLTYWNLEVVEILFIKLLGKNGNENQACNSASQSFFS